VRIPGKDTASRTISWSSGYSDGNARRIVVPVDGVAKGLSTGIYPFTLEAIPRPPAEGSSPIARDVGRGSPRTASVGRWWRLALRTVTTL
jgi:hypothetical protein